MVRPLWELQAGESGTIEGYMERLDKAYRGRLKELGFHPGERVTCVHAPRLGAPKLYRVNCSVFSLDDQIAQLVQVRTGKPL